MTSPGANNPSTMLHLRVHLGVAGVYHREPHGFFGGEVTNGMLEEAQFDRYSGGFGRPVIRKPSAACGGPNATGGRCRGATGGVVFVDNLSTARRNQNRRTDKRAPEADRLVRQISTRGSRDRCLVRDDGDRPGCDLARACRKTARYEPGHRADRMGRLPDRVLPDLRLQTGLGCDPAPSSLTF